MGVVSRKINTEIKFKTINGTNKTIKYRPMVRSRHPSHSPFRTQLERLPFKSIVRFGSTTELDDSSNKSGVRIELNSIESIKNSSNKFLMKECFSAAGVRTARWYKFNGTHFQDRSLESEGEDFNIDVNEIEYPIVAKSLYGSKGKGNTLIKSKDQLEKWISNKMLPAYIFEKYYNYNKEYRLHVDKDGCFYTCRKMLKQEFKEHANNWQRHDDNCVWILEENENFDKPKNWEEIVADCVKALLSCGLDFGACDLKVQNNIDSEGLVRKKCDFIVVEINSAPSMGAITLQKYLIQLRKLLINKNGKK